MSSEKAGTNEVSARGRQSGDPEMSFWCMSSSYQRRRFQVLTIQGIGTQGNVLLRLRVTRHSEVWSLPASPSASKNQLSYLRLHLAINHYCDGVRSSVELIFSTRNFFIASIDTRE